MIVGRRWRRDPPHWSREEEGGEGGRQSRRIYSSEFDGSPFTAYVKHNGQTYEEENYRMFAFLYKSLIVLKLCI